MWREDQTRPGTHVLELRLQAQGIVAVVWRLFALPDSWYVLDGDDVLFCRGDADCLVAAREHAENACLELLSQLQTQLRCAIADYPN